MTDRSLTRLLALCLVVVILFSTLSGCIADSEANAMGAVSNHDTPDPGPTPYPTDTPPRDSSNSDDSSDSEDTPIPTETPTPTLTATPTPTDAPTPTATDAQSPQTDTEENGSLQLTLELAEEVGRTNGTTITVTLENTGSDEVVAPVVDLNTDSEAWELRETSIGNGTFRDSTHEILWETIDSGESVTAEVTVEAVADSGSETITVSADDVSGTTVRVSGEIQIIANGGG